ncbi:hypothetical protein MM1218R_01487 [Mycobacterium marinum]|uniref:hypothetical protein n=1 Tax=Mycobacterium marinum TaxID=1781 RepID=UPI000E298B53|nr:hypothetical protein [Mycobacterium marinum]AXN43435.1 hypothetical protein MM1218R_01487 [Mycobacterium marinum]RFZ11513.1 hypothetical protein DE4381_01101 [Mycobacterium marinum]
MADIRERLAEALSRAQVFGGRESLSADNLADVLLSLPGIEIVELPRRILEGGAAS